MDYAPTMAACVVNAYQCQMNLNNYHLRKHSITRPY